MDALAIGSDEGRYSMRKASVSFQISVITGDIRMGKPTLIFKVLLFEYIE